MPCPRLRRVLLCSALFALPLSAMAMEDHAHEDGKAAPAQAAGDHQPPAGRHDGHNEHDGHEAHDGDRGGAPRENHGALEEEHDHEEHGHGEHGHEPHAVRLSPEQRAAVGIVVESLRPSPMATEIRAPGEVRQDAYATARVSPRIAAQVIARRARLGEEVRAGQALVTLSSVAMAEAQGELMVAEREWQRVRKLGKSVVSERRYTEARIAAQQARARVLAYGMSRAQVERLLRDGDVSRADGRFQLLSPIDGTVVADDFILGELVEPGRVLFEVTDEHRLWIEARLSPAQAAGIRVGAVARWETATEKGRGEVIQLHHRLDESTRTLGVRIGLVNEDHRLHPGQFVQVYLSTAEAGMALSVPEAALQRSMDGDWVVFVETAEGFEPKEVERLRDAGGRVVIGGLPEGTPVVVRGAFFLQSELAKSGFAVHNH